MHGVASPPALAARLTLTEEAPPAEWDAFLHDHPEGSVEHLWFWRDVLAKVFGHDCVYLAARRGDAVVGVLPLVRLDSRLVGRLVVSLPFANYAGMVTSDAEAARALVDRAREIGERFGAAHVELRHVRRHAPDLPFREHKIGARLRLPATADALWHALDRKVRNQVRKAQKAALTTDIGGAALLADFYDVFARNMSDLGTPVFPPALFAAAVERAPGAAVFVVREQRLPVAAGIALGWRRTLLVPWAASLRSHRASCPNMLLYWSMLEWAIGHGYQQFDFGRSTPGSGTHRFKQQWGPAEFALPWEYVLLRTSQVPTYAASSRAFTLASAAWKRLPVWATRLLGPHIARHLP